MLSKNDTWFCSDLKKKGAKLNDIVLNLSFDYDQIKLIGSCFSFAFPKLRRLRLIDNSLPVKGKTRDVFFLLVPSTVLLLFRVQVYDLHVSAHKLWVG